MQNSPEELKKQNKQQFIKQSFLSSNHLGNMPSRSPDASNHKNNHSSGFFVVSEHQIDPILHF